MNLMEAIRARRSVRAYTSAPVARETIEQLLQAAVLAPTGMNAQPWAFGVITNAEKLKRYSERTKAYLLDNMDKFPMLERYRGMLQSPDFNLFHGAPALIVILAKPGGATPDIDCSLAAENLMLAATDMGLGTCWIGFFGFLANEPDVKAELGIPDDYRTVATIVIGHPAQQTPPAERNAPEVLFWQ